MSLMPADDDSIEDAQPCTSASGGASQWATYCLLSSTLFANFAVRYALPPLQIFIASELRLSVQQRSALLGAFFSGYIATQFPAGLAVQRWGPKPIVTANLVGHALFLAVLPVVAHRGGSAAIYACLAGIGLSQGPLGPTHAANKVACVPAAGSARAWALTVTGIGSKLAGPLSGWVVPTFAARFGWRAVTWALALALASMAAVWHRFGPAPKPLQQATLQNGTSESVSNDGSNSRSGGDGGGTTIEWRVFGTTGILATAFAHTIDNFSTYSIGLLAPSVLTESLHVLPHQLGPFLTVPTALNPLAALVVTWGVGALHRCRLPEISVQKIMTGVGGAIEAVFLLLLTAARTPTQFVAAWCGVMIGHCCHDHGFESNKSTSGGPDAAIIESVMNPIANIPGLVGPLIAGFFLRRFGSRMPLFKVAALCQASAAVVFWRWAAAKPARDLVVSHQHASEKANKRE